MTATRRPVARLAAAALAGGLAACTADISSHNIWAPGVPGYFAYAAAAGEVNTVVIGNPFGVPKETVDRAVTDAMQGTHHGPRTRFTTQPSDAARHNLRIVVMFDPPHTLDTGRLCGDPATLEPQAAGDRLKMLTAFCVGDELLSDVRTILPAPASPHDPAFRHVVASAMWRLIPVDDPLTRDGAPILIGG